MCVVCGLASGVVFPGGELDIPGSHYQNTSQFIFDWATKVRFHFGFAEWKLEMALLYIWGYVSIIL